MYKEFKFVKDHSRNAYSVDPIYWTLTKLCVDGVAQYLPHADETRDWFSDIPDDYPSAIFICVSTRKPRHNEYYEMTYDPWSQLYRLNPEEWECVGENRWIDIDEIQLDEFMSGKLRATFGKTVYSWLEYSTEE